MSVLQLKNIKKSFPDDHLEVLKGINLNLYLGEFVSILGESGVGKSTLMDIIGGLDSHYSGEVIVDGKSLKNYKPKQLDQYRRQNIGFVFQSFHLIGHLTALGNVLVALDMTNRSKGQERTRAKQLLKEVGLSNQAEKYPSELSGGQMQRVSIARALASDPQILIADEPTGALDRKNTSEILKLLDKIAQSGKLVLTVTHSHRVAEYGTRIIHLSNGKIDQDRTLKPRYNYENSNSGHKSHPLRMSALWKMTADNIKRNKGQNILTVLGSSIGLIAVILILGLSTGTHHYVNQQINSQVQPNVAMIHHHGSNNNRPMNSHNLRRISHVKGVKHVEYAVDTSKARLNYGKHNINNDGVSTAERMIKTNEIGHGKAPKKGEILISSTEAKRMDKKHPNHIVGKRIRIDTIISDPAQSSKKQMFIPEIKGTLKVSGIMTKSASRDNGDLTTYPTVRALAKKNHTSVKPQYLIATFKGNVNQNNATQKRIGQLKKNGKAQYKILSSTTVLNKVSLYVKIITGILTAIAAISLLVAAVMIIAILYISVNERTKEIGILRALGASKKNIRHLFLDQALLLGIISSILATVLSYGIESLIDHLALSSQMSYRIVQIMPHQIIIIFVITIIINAIASIMPSWKASRLDPIKCLNQ